ncbi:Conidiation protein 6-domain-containing protein [Favolaschia claudopus]|uniref:Conidiation protein 6-domain-containing protein n=1 Tax=Favolaschia claudopus TaxID=2862362 RepID=A0AAW0BYX7_9AGAR
MSSNDSNMHDVRVAAGLKSAIAREDVSDDAKARAQERLENMGAAETEDRLTPLDDEEYSTPTDTRAPSDDAKAHAREILEAAGYTVTSNEEEANTDEHQMRVLAGYKAALNNPRVSDKAKQHAREYLKQHGAQ